MGRFLCLLLTGCSGLVGHLNCSPHARLLSKPPPLPPFRCPHRCLPAGSNVTVTIQNRYNTYEFGGSKSVLLTTNSWVGGRNNFLGAAYITVGGLCFLTALAFFLAYNAGGCRRGGVLRCGFHLWPGGSIS